MTIEKILQLAAACQGVWVVTITGFIVYHYLSLAFRDKELQSHILTIALSFCLLTGCTVISTYRSVYEWNDLWQIMALVAYALADYALVVMLWRVTRKHRVEQRRRRRGEKIKKSI